MRVDVNAISSVPGQHRHMHDTPRTLWTIGHSILAWDAFVARLVDARIATLVDVRRHAGSRRHPQFSGETMASTLPDAGIAYVPMPDLGGRRSARKDSPNTAWRNASFRGYADYMETPVFAAAATTLADIALASHTAVMCAEALWWQCHRALISDRFKADGWEVLHLREGRVEVHPYTKAARIVDGRLDYWLDAPLQAGLF